MRHAWMNFVMSCTYTYWSISRVVLIVSLCSTKPLHPFIPLIPPLFLNVPIFISHFLAIISQILKLQTT